MTEPDPESALARARARVDELERAIAERDRSIAELQEAERAGSPMARHQLRIEQLRTTLAETRAELAEIERTPLAPRPSWEVEFSAIAILTVLCVCVLLACGFVLMVIVHPGRP